MVESTVVKVDIKWNKEMFKGVEVCLSEDIMTFKTQLYCLTCVPVDIQKITIAGGRKLKDTDDMAKVGLKNGSKIMLMGTAEDKGLREPDKAIIFLEDMTPEQRSVAMRENAAIVIPPGLVNLGNTCYMNSVVQCLNRVMELKRALKQYNKPQQEQGAMMANLDTLMASAGRTLMTDFDKKGGSFAPYQFWETMKQAFPAFAEKTQDGHHKQQDADECYTNILSSLRPALKAADADEQDLIGNLFEIDLEITQKCQENEEEPPTTKIEQVLKLACHIDNDNNPIDQLTDGMKISLKGQVEKNSPSLGRPALYEQSSKIHKLPSYLVVNFVRFYWKQGQVAAGTDAGKAKILRNVAFPQFLDVYEMCSEELKKSLDQGRQFKEKVREEEDAKRLGAKKPKEEDVEMKEEGKEEAGSKTDTTETTVFVDHTGKRLVGAAAKAEMKRMEVIKHDKELYREHGVGLDTGDYELVGVVTHKGRSADGGHYLGWVHASGDDWIQCDDEYCTQVKLEDILALRGGGDWHTAYLNIYRKIEITKEEA